MNSTLKVAHNLPKPNTLHTDYKAEILALNLIKYYSELDEVFLNRLGNNNRSFNKDIENISSRIFDLGELVVSIDTYREGIYDYLPEGLFHPLSLGDQQSSIENIVSQIKKQKEVETEARKFFQPFELESYYLSLNALAKENEFEITGSSRLVLDTIKDLWPLLNKLDPDTAETFIYILPFFHQERGNKSWFAKCMMAFLNIPVQITYAPNRVNYSQEDSNVTTLSEFVLGESTILNGSHYDGERNWVIHYGPIPYKKVSKYIPESNLRKLLKILYDYCLPATVEVEEYFVTDRKEDSFLIHSEKNTSRLGYSTYI